MANPDSIECPADTWTLVAEDVTSGTIFRRVTGKYIQTYRLTGEAAPTDETDSGPIFEGSDSATIGHNAAIDVYIMAKDENGEVRVDL